jgi:hypothetical protein
MAGTKRSYEKKIVAPDRVEITGSFICADTAAPTVIRGDGFTVGAPTTGLYTIALTDGKFAGCDSVWVGLAQATGEGASVIVEGVPDTDVQSGFFQVETHSTLSTPANLNTPFEVHFGIVLRNTSLSRRA